VSPKFVISHAKDSDIVVLSYEWTPYHQFERANALQHERPRNTEFQLAPSLKVLVSFKRDHFSPKIPGTSGSDVRDTTQPVGVLQLHGEGVTVDRSQVGWNR
jgi:hypothetical protein